MKELLTSLIVLLLGICTASAQLPADISRGRSTLVKSHQVVYFEDSSGTMDFGQVRGSAHFQPIKGLVPNFGISPSTYWLRFSVHNLTGQSALLIRVRNPLLDEVTLFQLTPDGGYRQTLMGKQYPLETRKYKSQSLVFDAPVARGETDTFYLRIRNRLQTNVPIYVGTDETILGNLNRDDLIFGVYLGIILIMFFYNLFLYFPVRDISYLYYVFYILCVGFTQFCLKGYGYRFMWSNHPFLNEQNIYWSGALSGISVLLFVRNFLQTRIKISWADKVILFFVAVDLVSLFLALGKIYVLAYSLIDLVAFVGSIFVWILGVYLAVTGDRQARFFIAAWSFFLLSIILYVIKDFGTIPNNLLTNNLLLIGSTIEIALLSFALADKINMYKKEKEDSQANALAASQENERLVNERTMALQDANETLNKALDELKGAQSKLVEAEKMASLGQLTAGIAHEINNPINFVKSNINPLKMDVADLIALIRRYEVLDKDNIEHLLPDINAYRESIDFEYLNHEIELLLKGIEEGALRTAEIVKGLRTFSHVDENTLKEVDLHEGIDATLGLIRNHIPKSTVVERDFGELPKIECHPGNINQVFMNIFMNAIQAIKAKEHLHNEKIVISTRDQGEEVVISIRDTGVGIPPEIREKIFDPFFTTKAVGEGTGLGLSIVFSIIEKHGGHIRVESTPGTGTNFIITLPKIQQPVLNA